MSCNQFWIDLRAFDSSLVFEYPVQQTFSFKIIKQKINKIYI